MSVPLKEIYNQSFFYELLNNLEFVIKDFDRELFLTRIFD